MAEFLVAARDLESGYRQGDPVAALPDGHIYGAREGLPDFWIVRVPSISLSIAQQAVEDLWEAALPGDLELQSADPVDRRIRRHRRKIRLFIDELPTPVRNELARTGETSLSLGQARSIARRLLYNRTTGEIEDSGIREFG